MELKLNKKDQESLNECYVKLQAQKIVFGRLETELWDKVKALAKGKEVELLEHSAKNTKIILKEEK